MGTPPNRNRRSRALSTMVGVPRRSVVGLVAALIASCGAPSVPQDAEVLVPMDSYPPPVTPETNPGSCAKVALGRYLFYDKRLSANGSQSCASCHKQELAFADGLSLPEGSTGEQLPRNSMGLTNVAYRNTFTWANPLLETLEDQALVPLLAEFPVELGLSGNEREVLERLQSLPLYQRYFREAFDEQDETVTLTRLVEALAAFERTMLSFDSPYDRFLAGDVDALSESAQRGFRLFFSEEAECYHCHAGPDLTNAYRSQTVTGNPAAFHNTGLYNLDEFGTYPSPNVGLFEFTKQPGDMGAFRAPSLRNVEVTAPYMHDGSIDSLEAVMDHYSHGGRTIESGANAGVGADNPYKDPLVFALQLSPQQTTDLVEFLHGLTDEDFLTREALSNPFVHEPAPCPQ